MAVAHKQAGEGVEAIVAALLEQYERAIYAYLERLVGDPEWAEALAQDTFRAALGGAGDLPGIAARRGWLFRIATKIAFRALKPWRRFGRAARGNTVGRGSASNRAGGPDAVEAALARLAPEQRAVLLLYSHHGLALAETATALGVSGDTVKRLLLQARTLLEVGGEPQGAPGHVHIREGVAAYDGLTPVEQIDLNAHLVGCAACKGELAAYRHMDRTLRHLPDARPSSRLQAIVGEALARMRREAYPKLNSPPRLAPPEPVQRRTPEPDAELAVDIPPDEPRAPLDWQRLALPLALALLFVASVALGMRGQDRPSRQVVVQPAPAVTEQPPDNSTLPLPSPTARAPVAIDAPEAATITFVCDDLVVFSPEFRALARSFEAANPSITIRFLTWEQLLRRVEVGGAFESNVDLMRLAAAHSDVFCADRNRDLIRGGLVHDLMPLARDDVQFGLDQFYPAVLQQVIDAGSLYLVPARFRPTLIHYSPDVFDGAGLTAPRPGWSWDDLLAAAAALTKRDGAATERWGLGETGEDFLMARFLSAASSAQATAEIVDGTPFQNREVLSMFRWFHDLYYGTQAAPLPLGLQDSRPPEPGPEDYEADVLRGRFAMWTDERGVVALPGSRVEPFPVSGATDNTTPVHDVEGWAISSETRHLDAAWLWVSYLSQSLPVDPLGERVPARRSERQMQAFWKDIPAEDRDAYEYALSHLATWSDLQQSPEKAQLYSRLVSMIRTGVWPAGFATAGANWDTAAVRVSQAVTLTFAAPLEQLAEYTQAASGFTDIYPEIRVKVVAGENLLADRSGNEILWTQMRSLAVRVDALVNPQVPSLVRSGRAEGILYDLSDMVSETLHLVDYYPNALEGLRWRGKTFALPGRVGLYLIHYHRRMFDQLGVPYPQPGWTWSDFDRTVRAVAMKGQGGAGWWGWSGRGDELLLLKSCIGSLVDFTTDPATPRLDGSAPIQAATWYSELLKDGLVAPVDRGTDEAAMWAGLVDLGGLDDLAKGGIGVAPFPVGGGSAATTPLEIFDAFAISANTTHPVEAWRWLLYLQTHPVPGTRSGGIPARRDSAAASALPKDVGLRSVVQYGLEHSQLPAPLRAEEYLTVQQLSAALNRIVREGQPAPAALKEAQAEAEMDLEPH